jgi:periplasmic mercuric ion binding protein
MKRSMRAVCVALALLVPVSALAGEIHIGIKGMVCPFCATGLKKTLGKEKGIQKVTVSLEQRRVTLEVDAAQAPTDERLRELVKDAGYETVSIERGQG